jgi:predicted methyltransferase
LFAAVFNRSFEMPRFALFALFLLPMVSIAEHHEIKDKVMDAMSADVRTAEEVARDRNRRPVETLEFFGLHDDMRVLELLPGGGWYTKLLAPVMRENGELFVAIGADGVRDGLKTQPGFDHINVVDVDVELVRDGPFGTRNVAAFSLGVSDVDLALTFRNMHNFTAEGRANMNAAVYGALKSGGHYGVIDHSKRHMAPQTNENRRRVDVVDIILEAQAAGFELVATSDLHYRPDDELRFEVGRKSVTGNTDRFTLLFKKP